MMDTKLHNVRFYKFNPKAINCMAYNEESKLLALSRSDNSIEIWNCTAKLFKQKETIGCDAASIEALVWFNERLFSAGLDGFILEYDLETFEVVGKTASTGGPIWCLALSPDGNYLAAGTEKGFVCLFTITEEGLLYDRILDKQQGRVLSIGWHLKSECLVTGSVDFIHLFSLSKGQMLQLPIARDNKKQETIVWCVALLNDMTIVSGDSRGKTSFFDSEFGTLIDDVSSHQADILSMQVSKDQKSVFVAGVDPAIVEIQQIRTSGSKGRNMWVKGRHRRIHTHDVRAMILTNREKLFSGGIDTYLTQSSYPPKFAIRYPATPPSGYFSISKNRRILLGYTDRVELWRLGSCEDVKFLKFLPIKQDRVKLLEISLKKGETLEYCSISSEGDKIAYVVGGVIKIFTFGFSQPANVPFVSKIKLVKEDLLPSTQVHWLNDDSLLTRTEDGSLQMITIRKEEAFCDKESFRLPDMKSIAMIAVSGNYIACVDSDNNTYVVDANHSGDWKIIKLPTAKFPVTALAINSESSLVFRAYSNITLSECNFKNQRYTELDSKLRDLKLNYYKKHIPVQCINYCDSNLIYLQDTSCIYVINRKVIETVNNALINTSTGKPKPKAPKHRKLENGKMANESRDEDFVNASCELFSSYERVNHVLMASPISRKELVSIEFSPVSLMDSLPQPLSQKKYGTG